MKAGLLKRLFACGMALILSAPTTTSLADLPRESMFYGADLDNLSLTAVYDNTKRGVRNKNNHNMESVLEADSGYLIATCDLSPWLDISGGLGQSKARADQSGSRDGGSDEKTMWMIGIHANIWHGDIFDPEYFMSRVKLHSALNYFSSDSSLQGYNLEWNEARLDLTLGLEIFSHGLGEDKTVSPYSLELFAGALYSQFFVTGSPVPSENNTSRPPDLEECENVGARVGVNLKVFHNFTAGWEVRFFDDISQSAFISYHF